jgi:uncharacterized protein (DUF58 family)
VPKTISDNPEKVTLFERLNTKLFDIPRFSPVHELKPQGPFKSRVIRLLWNFWNSKLSAGGRYFFLATGIFFGYGATSLEFQAFVPIAYSTIIWFFAFLALLFVRPNVRLIANMPRRIAAGENLPVTVQASATSTNRSGEMWLLPHRLPDEIEAFPDNGVPISALKKGENTTVTFSLKPRKRGVYQLKGFRVETDFPFGIINSSHTFNEDSQLLVYPKFDPLDRMELPMGRRYQPGGVAFVSARGESVEYIGNRDYREGDNIRDIDWRATARLNRPIVREYREEYFLRAAVVLDTHIPKPDNEAHCDDFERAVSLCAACGDYMNRTDYLVDILAAGPDLHHLLAGRGLASLDQMLDILACVDSTRKSPWDILAPALIENLEQIASVVCLFLNWDEQRRAFVNELAASGAAVKIIIIRDEPTSGALSLDVFDTWHGEIPVLGKQEFELGLKAL